MSRLTIMEALAREYWASMRNQDSKAARAFFWSYANSNRKYWPTLSQRCAAIVTRPSSSA